MKAAKFTLAALVIFLAGMAAGAAVNALRHKASAQAEPPAPERTPSPMSYRIDYLRRAQKELNLTEEQKSRIDGFVRESQERLRALWQPIAPQAKAEFDALRDKIRAELSEDQRARFDESLRERGRRGDNRERRGDEAGKNRGEGSGRPEAK